MAAERCSKMVWREGALRSSPCRHAAKVERNGVHFCGIHDPAARQAKYAAKEAEYAAFMRARAVAQAEAAAAKAEIQRRADCYAPMLETLQWLDRIGGLGVSVHERITATIALVKP